MQELLLEDVLASEKPTKHHIDKLDKYVYFKELVAGDTEKKGNETANDLTYRMLQKSWVKEDGTAVFKDVQQAKLCKVKYITDVIGAMSDFNGISESGMEEIEKN